MKKFLLLFNLLLLMACEDNTQQSQNTVQQDSLEFSEPLPFETNRSVTLMPEAREAVGEWLAYATARHEIETLKSATGNEIIQNSGPILEIMENLNNTIPEELQVNAVKARTNVLLTKAGVLNQLAHKKNRNAGEIYTAANELITEFDNFKLQLNELFLPSPEDFELELDQEFEENLEQQDTLSESL